MMEPSLQKLFGSLFLICLLTSKAAGASSYCEGNCNNVTSAADAMINSGMAFSVTISKFNTAQIDPQIKDLNSRMKSMNLEAAGIRSESIPQYVEILTEYTQIKKGLITMRIGLQGLARETIKRANIILKLMKRIREDDEKALQALKIAAKTFVKLMKKSLEKLKQAKADLLKTNERLSKIGAYTKVLNDELLAKVKELERNITSVERQKRSYAVPQGLDSLELIHEETEDEENCVFEMKETERDELAEKIMEIKRELKRHSFLTLDFKPLEFVKTAIDMVSSQLNGAFNFKIDY